MDFANKRISSKYLIYLVASIIVAFMGPLLFRHNQAFWFVWATLLFAPIQLGYTFWQQEIIICLVGIFTAIIIFLLASINHFFLPTALSLFLITTICMIAKQQHAKFFYPLILINIFAIVAAGTNQSFSEGAIAMLFVLAGMVCVGLLQIIFWSDYTHNKINDVRVRIIQDLSSLCDTIFSCFLQPEYPDNVYLFEKRLHDCKIQCLSSLSDLRDVTKSARLPLEQVERLDELYDALLDCAQLRWRVKDHHTFLICQDELTMINLAIAKIFNAMAQDSLTPDLIAVLMDKIKRLEENFHTVLQISAKDPVVFLLFIESLKLLTQELSCC